LVVGADGRDSVVSRQVAARVTAGGGNRAAYLYCYWSGLPADGYEWIYRAGLSAGVIPTGGGLCCLFVGGATDDIGSVVHRANGPAHAYRWLAERAGLGDRLRAADRAESVRYLRGLPAGYLRQAHGPGWALVGDAGHWLDPISTHGITSALRDADLLARALATTAPDSDRRRHALREYQRVRDRLSLPLLRNADEIAGYRWDMPRLRALLRAMASAMSDEVDQLVGEPAA
jgi:2-polyprenyl-6-methoxyphenol hydroxylase-like FAD-dependent oxidoreductase